jgi:hypothetical protein
VHRVACAQFQGRETHARAHATRLIRARRWDHPSLLINAQHVGRFDLVLSGINKGNNYGLHVIYSGTVAGAREAAAKGVPAVALSLDSHASDADYAPAAAAALPLLRRLLARLSSPGGPADVLKGTVLNVNFPVCTLDRMRGYELTRQARCSLHSPCMNVLADTERVRCRHRGMSARCLGSTRLQCRPRLLRSSRAGPPRGRRARGRTARWQARGWTGRRARTPPPWRRGVLR